MIEADGSKITFSSEIFNLKMRFQLFSMPYFVANINVMQNEQPIRVNYDDTNSCIAHKCRLNIFHISWSLELKI